MPTRLQSTLRFALLHALGTAFKELMPSESLKTQLQAIRLRDLNTMPAVAVPMVGQIHGGLVIAGREMQFRRFGMMALSHRLSIAEVAALDEPAAEKLAGKALERVALRVCAQLSTRLKDVTGIRPCRPSSIPGSATWPSADFDLFTGRLIQIGNLQLAAYVGMSATEPAFSFPPVAAPAPALAQTLNSNEIGMDVGTPPDGFEMPAFEGNSVELESASTRFDDEPEELGEDGTLVREGEDVLDDDMWD